MNSVETDKMMDILSEITSKILRESERRKQEQQHNISEKININNSNENKDHEKENNIISEKKLDNTDESKLEKTQEVKNIQEEISDLTNENNKHSEKLNDFIESEIINDDDTSYLTKSEIEEMLNEHFKRVEDILHDYNEQNIDADTFKGRMNGLLNHFKDSSRMKIRAISRTTTKPIRGLREYARSRINQFMSSINERLKRITLSIDEKIKQNKVDEKNVYKNISKKQNNEINFKQKIENTLKNDPKLLKEVATLTRLNAINKHLNITLDKINDLDKLQAKNPKEQQKISTMKEKLHSHAKEIKNEVNELNKSHSKEETIEKVNSKVMEIERTQEVVLER